MTQPSPSPARSDEDQALRADLDAARQAIADYEAINADKRRLARLIDVAMHGKEGAAEQPSLCDLVGSAEDLRTRATAAEAERDKLRSDLSSAMVEISTQAQARGEAEGRLRASELAGVVEGWQARAEAAESALLEKDGEIKRLRGILSSAACEFDNIANAADPFDDAIGTQDHALLLQIEKRAGLAADKARTALAPTDPLPATDDESSR